MLAAWDGEDNCLAASGRSAHFIDFRVSMPRSQLLTRCSDCPHFRSGTTHWIYTAYRLE